MRNLCGNTLKTFLLFIIVCLALSVNYLILRQRRLVFVGEASLNQRRQCFGPPLSHPGVRVLADLQDTSHNPQMHTQMHSDNCEAEAVQSCDSL